MILSRSEVSSGMAGSVDHSGVRFDHGDRLFRAFREPQAAAIRRLLESPARERIFGAGLVPFAVAEHELTGFDLTVEMHRVPVVTYPPEWPTSALRDAALAFLDVVIALGEAGFGIKDGHPWNILFENRRPVFVDLGSITGVPTNGWLREFQARFAAPLALHGYGAHGLAERVLADHRGVAAAKVFGSRAGGLFPPLFVRLGRHADPVTAARTLRSWVSKLSVSDRKMAWSAYDQQSTNLTDVAAFSPKQRSVHGVLAETEPGTVLDMAANAGWYSELAAGLGHRVVAADIDDAALGKLHSRLRGAPTPIDCARLDFVWPKGSHGMGLAYSGPYDRLRCDTLLALALLHHLAGRQGVTFGMFASIVDQLATRRAVIEFVPADDEHVRHWPLASEPWYTQENLVDAFSPFFTRVRVMPSSPEPRRILVFDR